VMQAALCLALAVGSRTLAARPRSCSGGGVTVLRYGLAVAPSISGALWEVPRHSVPVHQVLPSLNLPARVAVCGPAQHGVTAGDSRLGTL
jgi:hypothetical protein